MTRLLHSAGLAIKALTGQTSTPEAGSASVSKQKESFTAATSQYFSLLSSIDVRLRRQVYALEEAKIIQAETASKDSHTNHSQSQTLAVPGGGITGPNSQTSKERSAPTNGGMGHLDVGWLNSRNDKVGKEMEAELWEKAKDLVEVLVSEEEGRGGGEDNTDDIDMDHDEVVQVSTP